VPNQAQRFGIALRDLLLERGDYLTPSGNVNMQLFSKRLPTYHYETLRKAVTGERQPTVELIEEVAAVLGVEPGFFSEYGLLKAQQQFDVRVVGLDAALENLERWSAAQGDGQTSKQGRAGRRSRRPSTGAIQAAGA
jgi:transcriptional regulator with XRE-family HTH domain